MREPKALKWSMRANITCFKTFLTWRNGAENSRDPYTRGLTALGDYPGKNIIVTNRQDGDEDFMAIGRGLAKRIENSALVISDLYVRHDHCLIIDKRSLQTLATLQDRTPLADPDDRFAEDGTFRESPQTDAWVWMLDLQYYKSYSDAGEPGINTESRLPPYGHPDERRFEPWVRICIGNLPRV